ncbi:MAG: hypothetical protein AAB383_02075 [Patescibacteria group bacterium]
MSLRTLAPLALGTLLASSSVEAGISEKPGTFERQQSGDCSGYRTLTRDMIQLANAPVEDSFKDSIQAELVKRFPDGNRLQIYSHQGEIIGNVDGADFRPIESAVWTSVDTSTACQKERADFKKQAELFLSEAVSKASVPATPSQEVSQVAPEPVSPQVTESKNPAARKALVEMTDMFGYGPCREARLFSGASIVQTPEDGSYWKQELAFLAGGFEVQVTGVTDTCHTALMTAPSEYSSAAYQWSSACTWGSRSMKGLDEALGTQGTRTLAAQCFDSVDSKRAVVKDPVASVGFNY